MGFLAAAAPALGSIAKGVGIAKQVSGLLGGGGGGAGAPAAGPQGPLVPLDGTAVAGNAISPATLPTTPPKFDTSLLDTLSAQGPVQTPGIDLTSLLDLFQRRG